MKLSEPGRALKTSPAACTLKCVYTSVCCAGFRASTVCVHMQCEESAVGGDHLHFHLLCLLEGPLQSQGWGHYGCEPLAGRHCLAISVLVLYSENIEQEPH